MSFYNIYVCVVYAVCIYACMYILYMQHACVQEDAGCFVRFYSCIYLSLCVYMYVCVCVCACVCEAFYALQKT